MSPILVGVAIVVSAGLIVAVSARDARTALVGLAVTMAAAPFLADPPPPLATLALRVVAAVLAAYLLRATVMTATAEPARQPNPSGHGGSRVGWPTETLLAIAAWIVGLNVSAHLLALNPAGPGVTTTDLLGSLSAGSLATGAGLGAIVLAIVPALGSRDGLRTAIGLLVLIEGILLLRVGVAGAPSDLEQLAGVAVVIAAAITGSMLVGLGTGPGSADGERTRPRRVDPVSPADGSGEPEPDGRAVDDPPHPSGSTRPRRPAEPA
ncbi:MAG: hypothetical protein EPO00_04630 [Chloroflexota bacterium]|nr:MAG: hypothetical protein EPO00_04630 [Chloroflexota bacterium]